MRAEEVVHELPLPWKASRRKLHPQTTGQTFEGESGSASQRTWLIRRLGMRIVSARACKLGAWSPLPSQVGIAVTTSVN